MALILSTSQSALTRPNDPYDPNGIAHSTDPADPGGNIISITIATPFSRSNGSGWNPAITTIGFDSGGGYTSTYGVPSPTNPTATPIFNGSNFLSGITIVSGGSGWIRHPGPGFQEGQVIIDIFIIQDNSTGDPDTREIKNTTTLGIDVTATDYAPGVATKASRAATKIAYSQWLQDYRNAIIEDSTVPVAFPDNGEIVYADD